MLSEEEMKECSVYLAEHRDYSLVFEDAVWLYYVVTKQFCSGISQIENSIDFINFKDWKNRMKSTLDKSY